MRGLAVATGVGAAAVMALAPQQGAAVTMSMDEHENGPATVQSSLPAPSAACVAAKNSVMAAFKADSSEDSAERNLVRMGTNTNDPAEDKTERANFVSLFTALRTACAPQLAKPQAMPPSAQCVSAKAALHAYFTQRAAAEQADWTNHTEWTSADRTEDAAAWAQMKTLFQNFASACGFTRTSP